MKIKQVTDYCLFDTETTGLDPHNNKIIEYACLRVKNNEIAESFQCYVNQNVEIPYFITQINGIDNALVKAKGIPPEEAIKKVLDFFRDDIIVGLNNIAFDYSFAQSECNRFKLKRPDISKWLDVGILYKGIAIGNIYDEKEPFFRYSDRVRNIRAKVKYNLNFLSKQYGVENLRVNDVHGALVDIYMTHYVFQKIKEKHYA